MNIGTHFKHHFPPPSPGIRMMGDLTTSLSLENNVPEVVANTDITSMESLIMAGLVFTKSKPSALQLQTNVTGKMKTSLPDLICHGPVEHGVM